MTVCKWTVLDVNVGEQYLALTLCQLINNTRVIDDLVQIGSNNWFSWISFYTPDFKTGHIMVYQCLSVRPFHMSRSNIRTLWPIHFKFHRVIGIDGLTVCILYGEISNFHSRVMELYSSNCRRFFVCRAVNWELLGQFTSNFA